ncbi:hypothetical protein KCU69_g10217, partial [Aureobasidium melanogenum]
MTTNSGVTLKDQKSPSSSVQEVQNPVIVPSLKMEPPSKRRIVDLGSLSDEELIQLERELLEGASGFDEKMALFAEEQKHLDARLEEARSTFQQVAAELEANGYRIVDGEVVSLIDIEPLRKWAAEANAPAARGWAELSEKVERCETAFNIRINGVMQILQSKPGQETPYLLLLKKYLTGGSEEDVCDPANVEDEKASEDEDEKEIKQEQ